jgi:glycerol uptake facilitator-like aquaporin
MKQPPPPPTSRLSAQAIFLEALGTGLLLFVIYGTAVDPRGAKAVSHMAPLAIGMSYCPLPLPWRTGAAAAAALQSGAGHGIGVT